MFTPPLVAFGRAITCHVFITADPDTPAKQSKPINPLARQPLAGADIWIWPFPTEGVTDLSRNNSVTTPSWSQLTRLISVRGKCAVHFQWTRPPPSNITPSGQSRRCGSGRRRSTGGFLEHVWQVHQVKVGSFQRETVFFFFFDVSWKGRSHVKSLHPPRRLGWFEVTGVYTVYHLSMYPPRWFITLTPR